MFKANSYTLNESIKVRSVRRASMLIVSDRSQLVSAIIKICLIFVFTTLLSSCVATGPVYVEPEIAPNGKSLVILYRKKEFAGSGGGMLFWSNNKKLVSLNVGGYSYAYLEPGNTNFSVGYKPGMIIMNAMLEPNQKYFVQYSSFPPPKENTIFSDSQTWKSDGYAAGAVITTVQQPTLSLMKREIAESEIKSYKFTPSDYAR